MRAHLVAAALAGGARAASSDVAREEALSRAEIDCAAAGWTCDRRSYGAASTRAEDGAASTRAEATAQAAGLSRPLDAYLIGQGFEGSASDWTEYVVWTVGVAALIFYLSGWVKIDVHEKLPPDADLAPPEEDEKTK